MWRWLLEQQCDVKLPQHIAIVLDGNNLLHYQQQTEIDLLPILKLFNYFGIPYLSLVLVSQTSLALPSTILQKSIEQIITQIKRYRATKFSFKYKLELFGDLDLLDDRQLAAELRALINGGNDDQPELTVRLGLFYSSCVDLFAKAAALKQVDQLSLENLLKCNYPPIDIFVRTSGVPKLSDLMLFELASWPVFIPFQAFHVNDFTYFRMYKLITRWQFFRLDRMRVLGNTQDKYMRAHQDASPPTESNPDEIEQIRREYYESTEECDNTGMAYFMYDRQ